MAEEKKPEADKNAPKKAAAPRRTKAKTSSKPEVKAQTADLMCILYIPTI